MSVDFPRSLIQEAGERRIIFFIGSGISKAAYPQLPTWSNLLLELSEILDTRVEKDLVSKLIRKERMLDAAQIITQGVKQPDLSQLMRAKFQIRPTPNNEIYRSILEVDAKVVVTTNYDDLIERNFEHYSKGGEAFSVCHHRSDRLLNDLRSPIRTILKLHGCVTEPDRLVLDRSSYFQAKSNNPSLFRILQALMTIYTVIFLGYSISDPDIQIILENVNMTSPSEHPHYAIMEKPEHRSIGESWKDTYNIEMLSYPSGRHDVVPEVIKRLRDEVVSFRRDRGIV